MRLGATKTGATTTYNGLGDQLYDNSGARPTLDLNFASNGSLVDSVTGKTLVTHTRQSNATYVDGDGIIKDAVTNLFLHSEPDAALTGWTIGFSTGTFSHTIIDSPFAVGERAVKHVQSVSGRSFLAQSINVNANTTYTASFYVDKTQSQITSGDTVILAVSNITGGTVSGDDLLTFSNAVNGKNTITFTTSSGVSQFQIRAGVGVFGNSTGTVVFGNLQLEQSSTAGEYVKTTSTINSAPRFDHNPTTGESLGLLVEESRTNLVTDSEDFTDTGVWADILDGLTRTANQAVSPDGTTNATLLEAKAGTSGKAMQDFIGAATIGDTYTSSLFAKAGNWNYIRVEVQGAGVTAMLNVDLSDGTRISSSNEDSFSIQDFGNGWYRISVTATAATATGYAHRIVLVNSSGLVTDVPEDSSVYIWGAQLEAGSFPTSYIRTTGSTATRSADVTSIEGNDFGTFNLLQYSEEFDQSAWSKDGDALVATNTIASPDSTLTADTLTVSGGGANRVSQSYSVPSAGTYTFSFYAKAGTGNLLMIRLFSSGNDAYVNFDFSTGVMGSVSGGSSPSATAIALPNGWYRLTLTNTYSGAATLNLRIGGGAGSTETDTTFYLWGAQLEQSSTATPYVKSDVTFSSRGSTATYYDYNGIIRTAAVDEARNVAFLPDGNGNFVSAGELLLEDAGENLWPSSNSAVNGETWNNVGVGGFDLASGQADPAGGTAAIQATDQDNQSTGTFLQRTSLANLSASTTVAFSVWVKPIDCPNNVVSLYVYANGVADYIAANFTVSGTTITSTSLAENGTGSATSASFEPFPNGWYRCSLIGVPSTVTMVDVRGRINLGPYQRVSGTARFNWYGAQLEANSYPTSYIPTYGSTATRAADVSSSSSNTFGNSFYNQTEGTVFVDAYRESTVESNDFPTVFYATDGSDSNRVTISYITSALAGQLVSNGGTSQATNYPPGLTGVKRRRIAGGFKENDFYAIVNGLTANAKSDTDGTMPSTIDQVAIGAKWNNSYHLEGTIARLTYWPTRLSNDTLQTITV